MEPNQYETLKTYLAHLESHLKRHMGGLFIFEDLAPNIDSRWREQLLADIGLVERSIKVGYDILIWSGRSPKNPAHPRIDALSIKPTHTRWQISFRESVPEQIPKPLEEIGCKVIDISTMLRRLHNSGFPLDDFSRAMHGFGTGYEGPCGICLGVVDTNGQWFNTIDCMDGGCPTSTTYPGNAEYISTVFIINAPFSNGSTCPHCLNELTLTNRVASKKNDEVTHLRCDSQCPCTLTKGRVFPLKQGDKLFFK